MNLKATRWQQRYENLQKAYSQLMENLAIPSANKTEQHCIIKSFEFTYELSWKTLKDYLEAQGLAEKFPRSVLKRAFQAEIIQDGHVWMDMIEKRNLMAHTYDQKSADLALQLIRNNFAPAMTALVEYFKCHLD